MRPGHGHGVPGAADAFLQTWGDRAETFGVQLPFLDSAALRAKSARGSLQHMVGIGPGIDAAFPLDQVGAQRSHRPARQRLAVASREHVQRVDDPLPVGDRREQAAHAAKIGVDAGPDTFVQHRSHQTNHGADLLDAPPRVMNGFVALRVADRLSSDVARSSCRKTIRRISLEIA